MTKEVMERKEERVILVGIATQRMEKETEDSVDELEELAQTAGAITIAKMIQKRDSFHPATYIGKGKIEEVKEAVINNQATGVICDDELTPAQLKNLEKELEIKVMDRTMLILDIFASHAHSKEGMLQVELAQLKYRLKRLVGMGEAMSRLGAGIGTRGPGEKKLETDRRYIRNRISLLSKELSEIKNHQERIREGRKRQGKPMIAIVGYTNAGKSTLLNHLTDASVIEEDMLFATLDPTTRNLVLPDGKEILLTDTVGFIRKLPHHLVEAFRSTLEEAVIADLLIHVVDCSNPDATRQMEVVYDTLNRLGAENKPVLTLFNKVDKENADQTLKDLKAFQSFFVSAKNDFGIDQVMKALEDKLKEGMQLIKTVIPYDQGNTLQGIRTYGQIVVEEYENDGIYIEAYLEEALINKYGLRKSK